MKVVIDGKVYDANQHCVVMVFEDDNERQRVASHINNMPEKEGIRAYASFPAGLDGHKIINEAVQATFPSNKNDESKV